MTGHSPDRGGPDPAAVQDRAAVQELFRSFFRRHGAGVAIITTLTPHGPVGFTASSLASVSSAPPMVSFNVSNTSSSWAAWQRATHVGVHRLTAADAELAAIFASGSGGAARFEQVEWSLGPHDVPVLRGPDSWLLGRIGHRIEAGDSSVLIAEVRQVAQAVQPVQALPEERVAPGDGSSEHPLVYATGQFALALPLAAPLGLSPARVSAA